MMTSSGLRSGISGVINLGVAFSMARSANIRDISSPDYQRVRSSRANLLKQTTTMEILGRCAPGLLSSHGEISGL